MIADARWIRLWEVFHEALDRPPSERGSFVATACADDEEVRCEVQSLLMSHELAEGAWAAHNLSGIAKPVVPSPQPSPGGRGSDGDPTGRGLDGPTLEGKRVGRYTVGRLIASGGSGAVYEAQQHDPSRKVALKVIRAGMADRRAIRRFELEAEVLARLHHPNIAQVYEAGTFDLGEGGQPFLAMEFIDGLPLTEFAQREGLDMRQRVALLIDVCRAVHHAHQRGVIHRDLKPANILVETESGRPQPKVLDFGVARLTDGDISATLSRQFAEVAGTIPYMSPEQFGGDPRKIDVTSDVYSLGVVCYEMLSDRLPLSFTSSSIFDAAEVIREQSPAPLGALDHALRGDLQTVVHKAMEKEPAQRYASAADLADDLQRWLDTKPIAARPPTTLYRVQRFAQRNQALVAGACALLIVLIAGTVISTWQAVRATWAQGMATDRYNEVRSLAKSLMFDLHDAIADLPGGTPVRRKFVATALAHLERLQVEGEDDPMVLRDLAEAYERIGDVQGNGNQSNLGDVNGARQSYDTARGMRERLLLQSPLDRSLKHELARVMVKRGQLTLPNEGGGIDPGMSVLIEAGLAMLETLARDDDDPALTRDLADALIFAGLEAHDEQLYDLAEERLKRAASLLESQQHREPNDSEQTLHFAQSRFWLAMIQHRRQKYEDSLANVERAEILYTGVLKTTPLSAWAQASLARARMLKGLVLTALSRGEEGVETARLGLSLAMQVSEEDPENQHAYRLIETGWARLYTIHAHLADVAVGDHEKRKAHWNEALHAAEQALLSIQTRQQRGWLNRGELHYPNEVAAAIEQCRAALAELELAETAVGPEQNSGLRSP